MKISCVICTEIFVINSHISAVNCGHIFHEDCLSKWLNSGQKTCPQCRCSANSKSIIKKLYLTEADDGRDKHRHTHSISDEPLSTTQLSGQNEELINEIAVLREELREKQTQLQLKSNVIEQKDSQFKELEATHKHLKKLNHDRAALIDFFKGELKAFEKIKDDVSAKEKRIHELESRLTSYKWVDMIYNDHEAAFATEMRKLSADTKPSYDATFVQELVRCNVVLKEHTNKLAEEKRQLRRKYFNLEKQLNVKDKELIDKDAELEKLREEMTNLELLHQSKSSSKSLQKDVLKRNFLSDSPLVVKQYDASIIDDSLTTDYNSPNQQRSNLTSNNNETVALLVSNEKKRKNPFAKLNEKSSNSSDDDTEFFLDSNNKQIKLGDISKMCFNTKNSSTKALVPLSEVVISDDENEKRDRFNYDNDVLVVKPIEHKKFGFKTKSASSLMDQQQHQQKSSSSSVYSYVYDGLGGHRKFLSSSEKTTTTTTNATNKNLTKFKVSNVKSPFLK